MTAAVVDEYQQRTEALAASTAASVLALYAALQAGGLPPAQAVEVIAAVVNTANAAATTLADVFTSAQVEAVTSLPQPPTGIAPTDDGVRLIKAVETILADLPEPGPTQERAEEPDPAETAANRLERLARAEPLDTGQAVTVEIVNRLPVVEGWTRKLDADPCERCVRWAEDGRVFPKDHHFKRHLNCNCQQEIVIKNQGREGISS